MLKPRNKGHGNCVHVVHCASCSYKATTTTERGHATNKPMGYFAAVRRARQHAKGRPGHLVTATDMTCLDTVARYRYDELPGISTSEAPF
jgi:hypothetical protein